LAEAPGIHRRRLNAIIDFGALTAGDPASDLSVAWMFLPPNARAAFWSAYAGTARTGMTL
jgi:aminoglycoside phosphotransferase (APT) family kinase protein